MHAATLRRRARLSAGFAPQAAAAVAKPSSLDIAEIRQFPVREPVSGNRYALLRVKTRSGVTGWGEGASGSDSELKALESVWVGKPAHTYAAITPTTPLGGALDMALLDILGKACNAPVYRVLGGPTRSKARAFSAPYGAEFPITVIEVPAPVARNQGKAYQNRIRELVDAVPDGRDFVLAGNGLLTPGDAASVATTVETKHPLWFDEPCAYSNVEAVRKVSGETVVPLGFGRGIRDAAVFQGLLRDGLIDIVRPELAFFGITGARRIAALAEPYYVAVAPRHDGGPVMTAAAIQLAASIPNFFAQNLPLPTAAEDRKMRQEIASPDVETGRNGFLELPKGPGLGITVNESALEKYHAA
ncbi:MAG TPA: enolase C-terminal domain-like protein [Bryobacteraceae bacterium]|nr:enolase C-terminal domain-like protein [Bryobacteraceae bacterium]